MQAHFEQRFTAEVFARCRLDQEAGLLTRTAAYKLIQYVYEHIPVENIKSRVLGTVGGEQVSCYPSLSHVP